MTSISLNGTLGSWYAGHGHGDALFLVCAVVFYVGGSSGVNIQGSIRLSNIVIGVECALTLVSVCALLCIMLVYMQVHRLFLQHPVFPASLISQRSTAYPIFRVTCISPSARQRRIRSSPQANTDNTCLHIRDSCICGTLMCSVQHTFWNWTSSLALLYSQ